MFDSVVRGLALRHIPQLATGRRLRHEGVGLDPAWRVLRLGLDRLCRPLGRLRRKIGACARGARSDLRRCWIECLVVRNWLTRQISGRRLLLGAMVSSSATSMSAMLIHWGTPGDLTGLTSQGTGQT